MNDTKICKGCNISYPATTEYFNRKGRVDNSLRTKCKDCEKAYREANKDHKQEIDRAYRQANKEKIAAQKSDYYQSHKEQELERYRKWKEDNHEHHVSYYRNYASQHREKKSEYDKQYREINRQTIMDRQKRWYHENIEHARRSSRAAASRYISRKRRAKGTHNAYDIERQYKAQKGRCYYCGDKVGKSYHVDHVVPLSRGGSNSPDNIVIACIHCNVTKGGKLPHEWGKRLL